MDLQKTKETIIEHAKEEAGRYKEMIRLVQDVIVPGIRRNDGRVLNKNLCNYIKAAANNANVQVTLSAAANINGNRELIVLLSQTHIFTLDIKTWLDGERNTPRIDADSTIDMDGFIIPFLDSCWHCVREREDVIENINMYMEKAMHFLSEIDQWHELPYSFTSFFGI